MGDYIILRINAGQVTANATVTPGTKTRRVSIHLHSRWPHGATWSVYGARDGP